MRPGAPQAAGAAQAGVVELLDSALDRSAFDRRATVDLYRGLGLWTIFIDHMSPNVLSQFTLWQFGFSDFAEIFVFLSGFIGISSYIRLASSRATASAWFAKLFQRLRRLYIAHVASLLTAIVLLVFCAGLGIRIDDPDMYVWMRQPGEYIASLLMLRYAPHLFALLPLYILVSPALLLAAIGLRRSPKLTVAFSFALWAVAQFRVVDFPAMNGQWHFHLFAWQFLFVLGGVARCYTGRLRSIASSRWVIGAAILIVAGSLALKVLDGLPYHGYLFNARIQIFLVTGAGKDKLAPYRLIHFLALLALADQVSSRRPGWRRLRIANWAILCGRDSLVVYSVSLLLDIGASLILVSAHGGPSLQVALTFAGLGMLCTLAYVRAGSARMTLLNPEKD